jgi:hypothetical protein
MAAGAFGRAMVAAGGTMFFLGVATVGVSTIGMGVARVAAQQRRSKAAVPCAACGGRKRVGCDVCRGARRLCALLLLPPRDAAAAAALACFRVAPPATDRTGVGAPARGARSRRMLASLLTNRRSRLTAAVALLAPLSPPKKSHTRKKKHCGAHHQTKQARGCSRTTPSRSSR